jgi:rhodanese-related sulfurtransferase
MNTFIRNIVGGIVIIVLAASLGVIHNAVRSQSMPLIQRVEPVSTARHGDGADQSQSSHGEAEAATPSRTGIPEGSVTAGRVKAMMESGDVYIIDARLPEAFDDGHIPGAINIPYDQLPDYYDGLTESVPTDATVICYCWSPTCDFSDQLATELKILGYADVLVFTGGWEDWQNAGYKTENGNAED